MATTTIIAAVPAAASHPPRRAPLAHRRRLNAARTTTPATSPTHADRETVSNVTPKNNAAATQRSFDGRVAAAARPTAITAAAQVVAPRPFACPSVPTGRNTPPNLASPPAHGTGSSPVTWMTA